MCITQRTDYSFHRWTLAETMALDKHLVPVLPFVIVIQCLTSRVDSNNQSLIMLNTYKIKHFDLIGHTSNVC